MVKLLGCNVLMKRESSTLMETIFLLIATESFNEENLEVPPRMRNDTGSKAAVNSRDGVRLTEESRSTYLKSTM